MISQQLFDLLCCFDFIFQWKRVQKRCFCDWNVSIFFWCSFGSLLKENRHKIYMVLLMKCVFCGDILGLNFRKPHQNFLKEMDLELRSVLLFKRFCWFFEQKAGQTSKEAILELRADFWFYFECLLEAKINLKGVNSQGYLTFF